MTKLGNPIPMDDIIAALPEERRKRIAQRAQELIAEHYAESPESEARRSPMDRETARKRPVSMKVPRQA